MIRTEAQSFLQTYTARTLANIEKRRRKAILPLWCDCYDAAAACNQKRSSKFDQLDHVVKTFGELTEMLLQVSNVYFGLNNHTKGSEFLYSEH